MDMEGLANLCRICLNNSYQYSNIYHGDSIDNNPVYRAINFVIDLQISEGDGLPEYVCRDCISIVTKYHEFKNNAWKGKRKLISLKQRIDQNLMQQEEAGEDESHNDPLGSVSDDSLPMQNQIFIKQEETSDDEVESDPLHSVCDDSHLLQNQDVKREDITIEECQPLVEECVFGDANQGNCMVDEDISCVEYRSIGRRDGNDGRSRGEEQLAICHQCGERTETKEEMVAHFKKKHGFGEEGDAKNEKKGKEYICSTWNEEFTGFPELVRHIGIHSGNKVYQCSVCEKSFNNNSRLNMHMKIHTADKPHKCTVCEKAFSIAYNLRRHMRTHTGDKPFKCSLCDKSFSDKSNLNQHVKLHTAEKVYKCSLCDESFSLKTYLQKHLKYHGAQKVFACSLCDSTFTRKSNLKWHTKLHTGDKSFECQLCNMKFTWKSSLSKHMKLHISDKL